MLFLNYFADASWFSYMYAEEYMFYFQNRKKMQELGQYLEICCFTSFAWMGGAWLVRMDWFKATQRCKVNPPKWPFFSFIPCFLHDDVFDDISLMMLQWYFMTLQWYCNLVAGKTLISQLEKYLPCALFCPS